MKLDNKVAIITGAASGIGREIALSFSREGATVVIFDVNIAGAEKVAQQIKAEAGTPALALQVDVGNSAQVNEAV